ncbi:putative universal stress protein UspA [Methylorubrum extorquens DM4]|uniref:Universal stress protein UspA n=1 Tax=Methylorubrum extorquens (strain DSM 6343 / CIP 106787 / DM4) TaxID=661410 RepID=C7CFA4_METED|nr:universal stress protein [Methylorubrum extorquens]CAX24302.1 putative universal stress protein UspA [Methylorubrum extorquens DM4]
MENVLACIDASSYAASVCDLAAWASRRLELPVELLHVVQRKDAVAERHDLSGAIGFGVKSSLLEELTQLEEADARLQVERGRVLIAACTERLKAAGAVDVKPLHRHGGIVEAILEREAEARVVVIGKRGASREFAQDHLGSKVERVVRASNRPILIASCAIETPRVVVLAYDGSQAAGRALERCANSPLFRGLPVQIVSAGADDDKHRVLLADARSKLEGRDVTTTLRQGKAEEVIANVVEATPGAILVMGAYGHSPLRTLIVGSTTTAMIRTVHVPVLLMR